MTDNTGAAFYPTAPSTPITFTSWTEANWDLSPAREDLPTTVGVGGDITAIDAGDATVAGATGRFADAGHQHQYTTAPNAHSASSHTDITRKIWIPVQDVTIDAGTVTSTGTAPDIIRTMSLADAASQGAGFSFVFDDWASSALSVQIYWAGSTTMAGNVRWQINTLSRSAGQDITAASTAVAFTSAQQPTANQLIKETLTSTTVTPANGDLVRIDVRRLGGDGADTYTGAALVIGILLSYTAVE